MIHRHLHKRLGVIQLILNGLFIFACISGFAQRDYFTLADFKSFNESYFRLADSTLKAEIGSFTFIGSLLDVSPEAGLQKFDNLAIANDSLLLAFENHQILIRTSRFSTFRNQLRFVPDENYLYMINGKPYWGYNGRVPTRQIDRIVFRSEATFAEVPSEAFSDLFEPNICRRRRLLFSGEAVSCGTRAFISKDGKRVYLHMKNGSNPLLYEVTFIFREGRYIGRVVDYAN